MTKARLAADFYQLDDLAGLDALRAGPNWCIRALSDADAERLNSTLRRDYENAFAPPMTRPRSSPDDTSSLLTCLPTFNHYRVAPIRPNLWLVSVESGDWTLVTDAELAGIRAKSLASPLRERLENRFVLLTPGNLDAYVGSLRRHYAFLDDGPSLHILVVTTDCDLRCVYCQAEALPDRAGRMTPETARLCVDRSFETPADAFTIEFQGGEPLLNMPAVQAAIDQAHHNQELTGKTVQLSIVSNFARPRMDAEFRYLIENDFGVCVSLDGPAEVHDFNRRQGHRGCFEQVKSNIRRYGELRKEMLGKDPEMAALMTTTKKTLPYAQALVETYRELGFEKVTVRPVAALGRGRSLSSSVACSNEEFVAFWQEVVGLVLDLRSAGVVAHEELLDFSLQRLFGIDPRFLDTRSPCGAACGQVAYFVDGSMFACDEGRMLQSPRFRLGCVTNDTLRSAVTSPAALAVSDASIIDAYGCDSCGFKPYCGACPVLHQAEDETLHSVPEKYDRCSIAKEVNKYILARFACDQGFRDSCASIISELA
jgi:radical SAM protein with 4Fe4S-binding SPASM domain